MSGSRNEKFIMRILDVEINLSVVENPLERAGGMNKEHPNLVDEWCSVRDPMLVVFSTKLIVDNSIPFGIGIRCSLLLYSLSICVFSYRTSMDVQNI